MNELEMRISELEIENERLKEWRYQLERSIEHNNKIMEMLKEENEEMQNRLRVYQAHCLKERNKQEETEIDVLDELSNAISKARNAFKGE
jgi:predicted RNase H-like nuclease (RuvC/YqgF family)